MSLTPYQARLLRALAEPGCDLRRSGHGYNLHTPDTVIQRVASKTVDILLGMRRIVEVPANPPTTWTSVYVIEGRTKTWIGRLPPKAFVSPEQPKPNMRALDILRLLQQRYSAPRHFLGVSFTVGGDVADAVAFHLNHPYRSTAFEIKITRSDFLREIANPRKNAELRRLVDDFIYVCPAKMLGKDEVPPSTGLMYAWKDRLRIVKQPAFTPTPAHVSRRLATAFLRRHGRDGREAVHLVHMLSSLIQRAAHSHPDAFGSYWRGDPLKDLIRRSDKVVREAVADGAIDPRTMRV